jgi:predicted TIM-barrel fold metal-dependent hydrolase
MIVDIETHPLLGACFARTNPGLISMVKRYTIYEHSPELLVAEMDQAGVDRAFLISYDAEDIVWELEYKGFSVEDYAGGRKYSLAGLRRFPDRFWWFNTVKDPRRKDAVALVRQDFADGASGIKLFPAFLQMHVNDPALLRVFEEVAKAGGRALVSFQKILPGRSIPHGQYFEEMAGVLERFPQTKFALMQAGAVDPLTPGIKPVLELVRRYPNVYLGAGFVGEVWDDGTEYPFANYQRRIETLVKGVGADRVMWGTDWPWFEDRMKYPQSVDCIRKHAHFMTAAEKASFLGDTAARFMCAA